MVRSDSAVMECLPTLRFATVYGVSEELDRPTV